MRKRLFCCFSLIAGLPAFATDYAPAPAIRSLTVTCVNGTGSLGVAFNELSDSIAHLFGMERTKGMWVSCTTEGEPAANAGVVPGDVVVALNGQLVTDVDDLPSLVEAVPIGATATLTLVRNPTLSTTLQQAVAEGDPAAQYVMGMMLAKRLCRFDESNAPCEDFVLPLLAASAEKGFLLSQIELGWMYQNGIVVPEDPVNALHWFERAAAQGSADAQLFLGLAYHLGRGISESLNLAVGWYRRAAEQGSGSGRSRGDLPTAVDQRIIDRIRGYSPVHRVTRCRGPLSPDPN